MIRFIATPLLCAIVFMPLVIISTSIVGAQPFACGTDTITDADGNVYDTVQVGDQCWTVQSMHVGTRIDGSESPSDNGIIEKYCYDDDDSNCTSSNPNELDGALYTWDEAMQYSTTEGAQGICPAGWHIPTDAEIYTMENYLDSTVDDPNATGWRGTDIGTQVKPGGSSGLEWDLAGRRTTFGVFSNKDEAGYFWSSSESSGSNAWFRIVGANETRVLREENLKGAGLSIRCIKSASEVSQMMQSDNFQIESDSVNVGGVYSESDSFQLEDTVGEIATGESESESFQLRAGYQQMQSVVISLTQPDSVVMDPSIPGLAGGVSNGSTSLIATTDNPAGYELLLSAESDPAMQNASNDTIADYVPVNGADFDFLIGSSDSHFGFSIESADALNRFLHDGENCGVGSTNSPRVCWDGLGTTPTAVVESGSANQPAGTETTIHFRVGVGGDVSQPPGTYMATTTVTAVPL